MHIEPALQQVLDSHVRVGCATFAKNLDSQIIHDTALLTLAGLGLARVTKTDNGEFSWVRSEKLVELQEQRNEPFDAAAFITEAGGSGESEFVLTESLSLIIDDIVAVEQSIQQSGLGFDSAWLMLAGLGYAAIMSRADDTPIWIATPLLILQYEMGTGISGLSAHRTQEVHVNHDAAKAVEKLARITDMLYGGTLPEQIAMISGLLTLEMSDKVVAELNQQGQLVWRAPEQPRAN